MEEIYEEYVSTMEEMVEALDKVEEDIVHKWNDLDILAKQMCQAHLIRNTIQNSHLCDMCAIFVSAWVNRVVRL